MACPQGRRRDSGTLKREVATIVDDRGACASAETAGYGRYGQAFVMMMHAADVRDWDDRAVGWRLGNPRDGRIFVSER
jgi:hypothetical protein